MRRFLFQIGSIKSASGFSAARGNSEFLFQIGSIKRGITFDAATRTLSFLFQIGSIKSCTLYQIINQPHAGFYSKLVRLKETELLERLISQQFLFQIGSIKSMSIGDLRVSDTGFYSKLVRLKADSPDESHRFFRVSIPNWFD